LVIAAIARMARSYMSIGSTHVGARHARER
jgi:hypothetical protein